jgi:hypothetical protein
MPAKLPPLRSLNELRNLADKDPAYAKLALRGSANLGGPDDNLDKAIQWLFTTALETDERGTLREVNALRKFA